MNIEAVSNLSPRQRECLRYVGELMKTEQIAAVMGISPSTVNTHIERAMAILGTTSRRAAALLVLEYERTSTAKIPTEFQRLSDEPQQAAASPPPATMTRRQRNDLTWFQRLAVAVLALAMLCIAIAGLGAAIEQLSDWRTSLGRNNEARHA